MLCVLLLAANWSIRTTAGFMLNVYPLLLQIRSAFQNCIILFTSLKVQHSTLPLNLKLLMLNQKNKKGTLFLYVKRRKEL